MGLTLKEELRRTFELATLRQEAKTLRTARHWRQANDLIERARTLREREAGLFAERYDTRVEAARRRLLDGAAVPARALQPRCAGHDRFSPGDLLRQARREVRDHHDRRMGRIAEAEVQALSGLVRQAAQENAMQGRASAEFARVAGPHHGPDPPGIQGPSRS